MGPGSDSEVDGPKSKKLKSGPSPLQQEIDKYSKGKRTKGKGKGKERDETDLLVALSLFRSRLKDVSAEGSSARRTDDDVKVPSEAEGIEDGEKATLEVDDDVGWMNHRLEFPKDNDAETYRAEHDYDVIDPRAKARDIHQEEREKKRARRSEVGRAFRKGR